MQKWFEREFSYRPDVTLFPNLVERVRGTPARLEERVLHLDAEILRRRIDGRWSIQENAGHLLDLESLWLARQDAYESDAELPAADVSNRRTEEAGHNDAAIGSILARFRAARAVLVARLDAADEVLIARTKMHPRLKTPFRLIDHVLFVAEHDDHHLARITEALRISSGAH